MKSSLFLSGTAPDFARIVQSFAACFLEPLVHFILILISPFAYPLTRMVSDKVGKDIWQGMDLATIHTFGNDSNQFGGTAFLQGLANHWNKVGKPRIILIGHSAGAIYICRFLQYADALLPNDVTFDVVFLAPACTFDLFAETLAICEQRIAGIRVFGMHDALEQGDELVPALYPRSLLYFISGVLEDEADKPLVGMERYYSGNKPYDQIQRVEYLNVAGKDRTVWSEAMGDKGRASRCKTHTGFYGDRDTENSLRYIMGNKLP